jgi:hypothetical protein
MVRQGLRFPSGKLTKESVTKGCDNLEKTVSGGVSETFRRCVGSVSAACNASITKRCAGVSRNVSGVSGGVSGYFKSTKKSVRERCDNTMVVV